MRGHTLQPGWDNHRPPFPTGDHGSSASVPGDSPTRGKRKAGYDPTDLPLPSNAVAAAPGERQVAYPPQFPRAKINGTPDGLTSVHIGVRPRVPPAAGQKIRTAAGKPKARGKASELGAEGEVVDWSRRREGYGEVRSDVDGSSPGGNHVDSAHHPATTRATALSKREEKRNPSKEQERAVPRMTLAQAVAEWETDHPEGSVPLSGVHRQATGNQAPTEGSEPADDGRAPDGIYTYDYSGSGHNPAVARNSTSTSRDSARIGTSSMHEKGTTVHVDGSEGPVRMYPPMPDDQNAYGVPFGKRLKALVDMRKEAEEKGLVPLSAQSSQVQFSTGDGSTASGLARRPAIVSRENVATRAGIADSPRNPKPRVEEKASSMREDAQGASLWKSWSPEGTPTRRPRVADSLLHTPLRPPQKNPRLGASHSRSNPQSSVATPSTPEPPANKTSEGKVRRKPVPTYLGEEQQHSGGLGMRVISGEGPIRKQKSESDVKRDVAGVRKNRKGRERDASMFGKSPTQPSIASLHSSGSAPRGISGDGDRHTPLKAPVEPRARSVPGNHVSASPASKQSSAYTVAKIASVAPPMPDGEEYDSDTEAERQAAWEEYYRLMDMNRDGPIGGEDIDGGYNEGLGLAPTGYLEDPGFPYNVGAVPEYSGMPATMTGMRPHMGMPNGHMGPGLTQGGPGMFYGYHPGMVPPQHIGAEHGHMGLGIQGMESMQPSVSGRQHTGATLAPPTRPHAIGRSAAYSDGRKDVRFAGGPSPPPKLTPRQSGYGGWRYPGPQGGYFSQDHTPANSAMTSPAVDAANPMDLYSPGSMGHSQYGHYGYSPYASHPSYPNTPSIYSAAGYNAQADPFAFEEMSEAIGQAKHSAPAKGGATLEDRRKKSWYGPRQ